MVLVYHVTKQILYYTHNILPDNIFRTAQHYIRQSGLPIVSVSHQPLAFGENILFQGEPGVVSMFSQILLGLQHCTADAIFFCEHDVLYHPSHFEYDLPDDTQYHYNTNVWRWWYPHDLAVTWDGIRSLSGLCCARTLALHHFAYRLEFLAKRGSRWDNRYGFEPGTKRQRQGGITDETAVDWRSAFPNVDIRHSGTITPRKCHPTSFKHLPDMSTWRQSRLKDIPGWSPDLWPTLSS
jgi:hypothetical protein